MVPLSLICDDKFPFRCHKPFEADAQKWNHSFLWGQSLLQEHLIHCKRQQRAFSTTQVYVLLDLLFYVCFVIHYSLVCIIICLLYSFLSLGLLFVCKETYNSRGRVFLWSCLNCWLPDDDEMINVTQTQITYLRPQPRSNLLHYFHL